MHRNAFYGLAVLVLAVDQAVKAWLRARLPVGDTIPVWPGVFHITHTQNRGMAFSLLEGKTPLLILAALVVIGVIVVVQSRAGARLPRLLGWSLALPLGGALGNLTDRVRLQYVTDLFDFRLINFPVFNVADAAITVGIALLAWRTLTLREEEPSTALPTSPSNSPLPVGEGPGER